MKVHNFSAGPSILPDSVIKEASNGILNINNSGLSLLEISHRSKDFIEIMDKATSLALKLLEICCQFSDQIIQELLLLICAFSILVLKTRLTKSLQILIKYDKVKVIGLSILTHDQHLGLLFWH